MPARAQVSEEVMYSRMEKTLMLLVAENSYLNSLLSLAWRHARLLFQIFVAQLCSAWFRFLQQARNKSLSVLWSKRVHEFDIKLGLLTIIYGHLYIYS